MACKSFDFAQLHSTIQFAQEFPIVEDSSLFEPEGSQGFVGSGKNKTAVHNV